METRDFERLKFIKNGHQICRKIESLITDHGRFGSLLQIVKTKLL